MLIYEQMPVDTQVANIVVCAPSAAKGFVLLQTGRISLTTSTQRLQSSIELALHLPTDSKVYPPPLCNSCHLRKRASCDAVAYSSRIHDLYLLAHVSCYTGHLNIPVIKLPSLLEGVTRIFLQAAIIDAAEISMDGLHLSSSLTPDHRHTTPLLRPTPLAATIKLSRLRVPQVTGIQAEVKVGRLDARLTWETASLIAAVVSETAAILGQPDLSTDSFSAPAQAGEDKDSLKRVRLSRTLSPSRLSELGRI